MKDMTIEKKKCAKCLVPLAPPARAGVGRSGNFLFFCQVDQKCAYFIIAHFVRMALVMEKDILAHPADVGLFGSERIVAVAKEFAVLVEQFFALRYALRRGGFPRRGGIRR